MSWVTTINETRSNILKLFLASNSSYLMYLFWHLGETTYSLVLSFSAPDTVEMQGACVGG